MVQTHGFQYSFLKKAFLFSCHDEVVGVIFVVDNVLQINTRLRIQLLWCWTELSEWVHARTRVLSTMNYCTAYAHKTFIDIDIYAE